MEEIKVEANHPTLCHGCLSQCRKTVPLPEELSQIFLYLVIPQTYSSSEAATYCWECTAMLRRVSRFRTQLEQAQSILMQMFYQMNANVPSLSKLSIDTKLEYDQHYEYIQQYIQDDANIFLSPTESNPVVKIENTNECDIGKITQTEPQMQLNDDKMHESDNIEHDFDFTDHNLIQTEPQMQLNDDKIYESDDIEHDVDFADQEYIPENATNPKNDKSSTNNRKTNKRKGNIGRKKTILSSKIIKNDIITRSRSKKRKIDDSDTKPYSEDDSKNNVSSKKAKNFIKINKNLNNTNKNNADNTSKNKNNADISNTNQKYQDNNTDENNEETKNGNINNTQKKTYTGHKSKKIAKKYAIIKNVGIDWKSVNLNEYFSKKKLDEHELEEYRLSKLGKREWKGRMRHKCEICNKRFSYKLDITRHIDLNHQTGPKFECHAVHNAYYKGNFSTLDELREHWKSHYIFYECNICKYCWHATGKSYLMEHAIKFHTKSYSCTKCKHVFGTKKLFNRHYGEKHSKHYCDDCGRAYYKKKILIRHIENRHSSRARTCQICNKTFTTTYYFRVHNRTIHRDIHKINNKEEVIRDKEASYCVECDKQFKSVLSYSTHCKRIHTDMPKKPCPDCGRLIIIPEMKKHYNFHHQKSPENYCDKCDKHFYSKYGLEQHIKYVHLKEPHLRNEICDICGKGFTSKGTLKHHRRTHTGERPHACNYCPATFIQRFAWISHEIKQHGAVHDKKTVINKNKKK